MFKNTRIIAIILLTVNVQFVYVTSHVKNNSDVTVSNIYEGLGYSPVCVASALASCERFAKPDCYLQVKSLLQNITCENKKILGNENTKKIVQDFTNIFNTSATDEKIIIVNELKTQVLEQNVAIKILIENEATFRNDLLIIKESVKSVSSSYANFSNIISNEIKKIIHAELNSSQEKAKTNTEDADNISREILSVHKLHLCGKTSLPDGVTTVYPYKENVSKAFDVLCDQTTDGGEWTVIQNRDFAAIRQDFNRSWSDYVEGFGDMEGEFWLGLDNIHALTDLTPMELRVDLEDYDGVKKWAKFDSFKIGGASTKYVLTLGNYSGDAGDSLIYHNGRKSSTYDQDNYKHSEVNCVQRYRGGWWFNYCGSSNLNGYQHVGEYSSKYGEGIVWYHFRGHYYSLKKASMKIRPK